MASTKYDWPSFLTWRDGYNRSGWRISVTDTDIDSSASICSEYASYAQISADEEVEVVSSDNSDSTQTLTIVGVDSDGELQTEEIELTGTSVAESSNSYTYVDQVWLDAVTAGNVTVRKKTGDTTINQIAAGYRSAMVAQHYNGHMTSYITGWGVRNNDATNAMTFTLEWQNAAGSLLTVLDTVNVLAATGADGFGGQAHELRVPSGSVIAVYGTSAGDNDSGYVWIEGYDKKD
jgi:hypothetical protein